MTAITSVASDGLRPATDDAEAKSERSDAVTGDELRNKYKTAYKIIVRERAMRERVFAQRPQQLALKVAEMDLLLEIITAMKDELKEHIGAGYEQPRLLDAPQKAEYR